MTQQPPPSDPYGQPPGYGQPPPQAPPGYGPPPGYGQPSGYDEPPPGYGAPYPGGLPPAPAYAMAAPQCQACGVPLQADGICRNCKQVAGLPPGVRAVEPGRRFAAFLLDVGLAIVTLVIGYLVWALIVWKDGQTPAKRILKMRIVHLETRRPATWGRTALRQFVGVGILSYVTVYIWFIVSVIMLLARDDRRAGWDLVANTVEVDERAYPL